MGRKRQVVLDQDEDIVSYEHNIVGKYVQVTLGTGSTLPDDSFVMSDNQNFEVQTIAGDDYQNLMAASPGKPAGVFRKGDLWEFVDSGRVKKAIERQTLIDIVTKPGKK